MNKRYAYFDVLKFLLIFSVVFGHILENYIQNPFFKSIYMFIYTFHMPLFVFITGFFAKSNKGGGLRYFILFIIFQAIHAFLNISIFNVKTNYSWIEILGFILSPSWTLWYIFCMPIWLLSLRFIKNINSKLIVFSILLAVLVGFIPYFNSVFSLNRLFYFYPFFLLGYKFGKDKDAFIQKINSMQKPHIIFFCVCVLVTVFLLLRYGLPSLPIYSFYGRESFSNLDDFAIGLLAFFLAFSCSFCIMIILPTNIKDSKHILSFNQIGKRTLSVYLLHSILLLFINKYLFLTCADQVLQLLIILCETTFIMLLSSLPFFNKIINSSYHLLS